MSDIWIPVDTRPERDGGVGLEPKPFDDSFSVKFRRNAAPRTVNGVLAQSFATVHFVVAALLDDDDNLRRDGDGDLVIWLGTRTEAVVCAVDPAGPDGAGRELWGLVEFDDLDRFFPDLRSAWAGAEAAAWRYLKDPSLFNRDIDWDGLTPWER